MTPWPEITNSPAAPCCHSCQSRLGHSPSGWGTSPSQHAPRQVQKNSGSKACKQRCYCWWLKSCTTCDVWNPINNGINYLSTGAGFQPSTVWFPQPNPHPGHSEHSICLTLTWRAAQKSAVWCQTLALQLLLLQSLLLVECRNRHWCQNCRRKKWSRSRSPIYQYNTDLLQQRSLKENHPTNPNISRPRKREIAIEQHLCGSQRCHAPAAYDTRPTPLHLSHYIYLERFNRVTPCPSCHWFNRKTNWLMLCNWTSTPFALQETSAWTEPQRLARPVDKLQKRGTFDSWHDDLRSQGHVLHAGWNFCKAQRLQGAQKCLVRFRIPVLIRAALCFSWFTCGLKGLVVFKPFTATLQKAKLQVANSASEACIMWFSAVVYGPSSVWLGLARDLPLAWQEREKEKERKKKKHSVNYKQTLSYQKILEAISKQQMKWPCCVFLIVVLEYVFCMPLPRADSLSTGRADRISSRHNSGMQIPK